MSLRRRLEEWENGIMEVQALNMIRSIEGFDSVVGCLFIYLFQLGMHVVGGEEEIFFPPL